MISTNNRYVNLELTFGEKIKLLFFGIIDERRLPVKEVVKEVEKVREIIRENNVNVPSVPKPSPPARINTKDELVIPFFNFDDETKSNF